MFTAAELYKMGDHKVIDRIVTFLISRSRNYSYATLVRQLQFQVAYRSSRVRQNQRWRTTYVDGRLECNRVISVDLTQQSDSGALLLARQLQLRTT